jgi:hypothetical protein
MLGKKQKAGAQENSPSGRKNLLVKVGGLLILVGLLLGAGIVLSNRQHNKVNVIRNDADSLEAQGKFTEAASGLKDAYDKADKESVKASIAYQIGLDYYDSKHKDEGKKWLNIAIQHYKKADDNLRAQNTQNMIDRYENLESQSTNNARSGAGDDSQL